MKTIVEMLNEIRASGKALKIETLNEPTNQDVPAHLQRHHAIKDVATDNQGNYLIEASSSAFKLDAEGRTTVEDRDEYINFVTVSRIILR